MQLKIILLNNNIKPSHSCVELKNCFYGHLENFIFCNLELGRVALKVAIEKS